MKRKRINDITIPWPIAIILLLLVALAQPVTQTTTPTVSSVPYVQGASTMEWDESTAPNYVTITGTAELPESVPEPGKYQIQTDDLKRPVYVIGNVTYDMMINGSERERDDMPNPTGWPKNAEVDIKLPNGNTYHGWFWNRSHLLAKSLGGPDTKENLVPGTRMQNVGNNDGDGGMAYTEAKVRKYLKSHKDVTMLYAATPVYHESELIPRSVIVDVKSSDDGINERVIVYNAQRGYAIDYTNGTWVKTDIPGVNEPQSIKDAFERLFQTLGTTE